MCKEAGGAHMSPPQAEALLIDGWWPRAHGQHKLESGLLKKSWESIGKALMVDLGRGEGVGGEYDQICAGQL